MAEPRSQLVDYLWSGIRDGFQIVDTDTPISGYFCHNYNPVLQNEGASFVNDLIIQELTDGKFVQADHKLLCVHALRAVHKESGGYRPITDCKRPLFKSINNFMEDMFNPFKYKSSDDVCNLMSPFCFMAIVDIASAYHTISIHPHDWEHQGLCWEIRGEPTFLQYQNFLRVTMCPLYFYQHKQFCGQFYSQKGIYRGKLHR